MILVDSDVVIAHLRGHEPARAWLREVRGRGRLATSVITVTEVAGGMRSAERAAAARLLGSFEVMPVTEVVALRAGELMRRFRRSHRAIGTSDYLIAATADLHGLDLATLNVRHFPMFEGLRAPFAA